MKLLQVVWNFPETVKQPFDMYYFYWPLHEAMMRGWKVEVLTFQINAQQCREEVIDGIRVRRCPAGVRKGKPFSRSFITALLTTDADIILCHGYGEGRSELALLLGRLRGRKVVFVPHFHLYPYRRVWREWYDKTIGRFFCNVSDRVVVFTEYTQQQLLKLGVMPEKLCVVPHVARPDIFASSPTRQPGSLLRRAGIARDPLLLGVGQLIERKGWAYMVRCLPAIIAHFPDAQLLIVGPSQPAEPDFRCSLLQLAKDLNVADHLYIVQDNTPEFILDAYRSATILTHPSFVESFGMVLLEAMTAGLPIIAHNGTGIPCIVDDGVTGYVVDVRNVSEYTRSLLTMLGDPLLRQRMGDAGKKRAETYFSQARSADTLFDMFAEMTVDR